MAYELVMKLEGRDVQSADDHALATSAKVSTGARDHVPGADTGKDVWIGGGRLMGASGLGPHSKMPKGPGRGIGILGE